MTPREVEALLLVQYTVAPDVARNIRDRLEAGEFASEQARELFELNHELKKQLGIEPKTLPGRPGGGVKLESSIVWNETNAKSSKD